MRQKVKRLELILKDFFQDISCQLFQELKFEKKKELLKQYSKSFVYSIFSYKGQLRKLQLKHSEGHAKSFHVRRIVLKIFHCAKLTL